MTQKTLCFLTVLVFTFTLSACSEQSSTNETNSTNQDASVATDADNNIDNNDLDAVGDIEVDKGLLNVTLQIPAEFAKEGKTQEDYDALAKENDWKSITLNDDGSLTYVMTKKQHDKMMKEMVTSFESSLDEMINSENYPNFVKIEANKDYTEFEVTTKSTELDFSESFSTLGFYMTAGMYNIFNGTPIDNCHVVFINEASGEIISEANSSEMGN